MTSVAIIGTGFGGIAAAVRLKRAGVTDLVLFERADDVGGVWRENTYPGAACDVMSHLYSLSFAPKPDWSRTFAPQTEIHQYLRDVARDFDVLRHVRFSTEVLAAAFDEAENRWVLTLSTGEEHRADVLIAATGQLSRPSRPAVPGLENFRGTVFHSAQWNHEHDVTGRRVAVVGTGASAIQFVPAVAPATASLSVFQRSAPYVLPKPDGDYSERARSAYARVPGLLRLSRARIYATNELRSLGFNTEPRLLFAHRARFRRYLREAVPDAALRARLTPTDPMGCKRILMSNDWYRSLQLPQVEVVTEPWLALAATPPSCSASVMPALAWPSLISKTAPPAGVFARCASCSPRRYPAERLVMFPGWTPAMRCFAAFLSVIGSAGISTLTSSSKVTSPNRSAGSSRSTSAVKAAFAPSSRSPAIEPLLSNTTTNVLGDRSAAGSGVGAVNSTSSDSWSSRSIAMTSRSSWVVMCTGFLRRQETVRYALSRA